MNEPQDYTFSVTAAQALWEETSLFVACEYCAYVMVAEDEGEDPDLHMQEDGTVFCRECLDELRSKYFDC